MMVMVMVVMMVVSAGCYENAGDDPAIAVVMVMMMVMVLRELDIILR